MKPVLLDTGAIVALLDRSERFHEQCVTVVRSLRRPLVTCEAVIVESCYLLRRVPGASEAVVENVETGAFLIPFQLSGCTPAIRRLLRKYRSVPIDLADACLVQMASELSTGEILTLDGDFEVYRWAKDKRFELLISLG